MAAESPPHRKATTLAIRSGGTSLWCSDAGIAARFAGVSIWVGTIAWQRTPSGLPSAATARAKAITAALDAAYPAPPANGFSAALEPTQTIDPPPAAARRGSAAWVTR